uniref:Class II aldolase/adducin N-terminal domain-containing protein n=1 Tax=Romanomermis culicivorax TaxID=13658 RepID=A0A915LD78_ROMCU
MSSPVAKASQLNYSEFPPIDDLDERSFGKSYNAEERDVRKKLAALYRLVYYLGWSEGIYNHLTVRVPRQKDQFLIQPFGFLYNEVTASSLLAVDTKTGNIVDHGSTNFGYINRAYTLHSAVLNSRADINCVLHLHIPEVVAISSLKNGYIPFSQHSAIVGPVSIYDFQGVLVNLDECKAIVETLGQNNAMILRNHGFVVCGKTVEETFIRTYILVYHLKAQAAIAGVSKQEIIVPNEESTLVSYKEINAGEYSGWTESGEKIRWNFGELDWQAWMRFLDRLVSILFYARLLENAEFPYFGFCMDGLGRTVRVRKMVCRRFENRKLTLRKVAEQDQEVEDEKFDPVFKRQQDLGEMYAKAKHFDSIPGPKQWPIVGNLLDYRIGPFSPQAYHRALCDRYQKYGPLVRENFAGRKVVHVFDPDDARIIYQSEGKTPYVVPLQETALMYRNLRKLSLGLGNMNGEEWYRLKKNVQQAMLRPRSVFAYISMVEEVAEDFVDYLSKKRLSSTDGKIPDLKTCVAKWSLESSSMLVFEKRIGSFKDDQDKFAEKMIESNSVMFDLSGLLKFSIPIYKYLPFTPKWRRLVKAEDYFYDHVKILFNETLDRIKKQGNVGHNQKFSFMTYLLSKPDLTQEDIYIICLSLFGDGLNTTAPALIYNLYCLAENPDVQNELNREIIQNVDREKLSVEILQKMPYLKACVKECFRLYPVGTEVSRIIQKNLVLQGYQVPAGTAVEINMGPQLKKEKYFKNPAKFSPERWLSKTDAVHEHPFVLTPFGHGPRMCAGRRFAEQDLYIALTKIVSKFKIKHEGPPVDQEMRTLLLPTNTECFSFLDRC